MKKMLFLILLTVAIVGISAAQTTDPSDLFIGTGFGTPGATGAGLHPNPIGTTDLSIYLNGMGQSINSPVILILGVADFGSGTVAPTISSAKYYAGNAGSGTTETFAFLGMGVNLGDGTLDATDQATNPSTAIAYDQATFDHVTDNSESWTNWSGLVPGTTQFDLYAYRINTSMNGGDLVNIAFSISGGLAADTFAIAYGCTGSTSSLTGACDTSGDTYSTPFTQAGFTGATTGGTTGGVTSGTGGNVPEPGSIVLLGTVTLLIASLLKKKVVHGR